MTSLDNLAHDGYCVGSSSEREVLDMEEYYGIDDFAEEVGFRCGDDDIMVEVLGSDVYVDGICGDGIGGDQCFTDVLASDDKLDTKLRPYGAVGISRKDSRLRDTFDDSASASSGKEGSVVSKSPHRFRHEWNDATDCTRKERRSTELMGDPGEYLEEASSSWKRHKVHDPSISSGTKDVEKGITISEDITTSCSGAKPSLNLTGSDTGSMESNGERSENGNCALLNGFEIFISELGEVQFPEHSLEQLQFAASNPLDGHEESILLNSEPSEVYQFEDSNDSYWPDRVIASNLQDQQYYEYEGETMIEDSRKLGTSDREPSKAKESSSLEGDCLLVDDNSPAELVVIFPKTGSFPVAATLNKTLKMFGPLKESETQVDRKSNRARVVFRKFGDAKVAFSSAQKYSIFGPLDVKYQLNHPISDP